MPIINALLEAIIKAKEEAEKTMKGYGRSESEYEAAYSVWKAMSTIEESLRRAIKDNWPG